jgi:hypothetical protein
MRSAAISGTMMVAIPRLSAALNCCIYSICIDRPADRCSVYASSSA